MRDPSAAMVKSYNKAVGCVPRAPRHALRTHAHTLSRPDTRARPGPTHPSRPVPDAPRAHATQVLDAGGRRLRAVQGGVRRPDDVHDPFCGRPQRHDRAVDGARPGCESARRGASLRKGAQAARRRSRGVVCTACSGGGATARTAARVRRRRSASRERLYCRTRVARLRAWRVLTASASSPAPAQETFELYSEMGDALLTHEGDGYDTYDQTLFYAVRLGCTEHARFR